MNVGTRIQTAAESHPFVSASGIAAVLTLFADVVVAILFYGDALGGIGLFFFIFALVGTAWLVAALGVRILDGIDDYDPETHRPTGAVLGISAVEVLAAVVVLSPVLFSGETQIVVLLAAGVVLAIASLSRASLVFFETDREQWTNAGSGSGS
ncbi:MAG: hypothetical protein ABEI99_06440 [Halobaculum sp.]